MSSPPERCLAKNVSGPWAGDTSAGLTREGHGPNMASAQAAFVYADAGQRIRFFSPGAERIFGYAAAEVIGCHLDMLMPQPDAAEHGACTECCSRTRGPRGLGRTRAEHGRRRDGVSFPLEVSVVELPALAGGGDAFRYAAFFRDMTETADLHERLVERERLAAVGATSAKFAHEVSNPLNGMLINVQLAQRRIRRGVPSQELSPLLERVAHQIDRLANLLHDFRRMSRRQAFEFRPTSPAQLLQEIADEQRAEWTSVGVELVEHWSCDLPRVPLDQAKMEQVLLNLCKNGVEAMPGGGTLTLAAAIDGERLRICVSDTGEGIPPNVDIFAPFATSKAEGTGLGLPIVQQIVHAHGGTLAFDSSPGEGTTFSVWLPLEPPLEARPERADV